MAFHDNPPKRQPKTSNSTLRMRALMQQRQSAAGGAKNEMDTTGAAMEVQKIIENGEALGTDVKDRAKIETSVYETAEFFSLAKMRRLAGPQRIQIHKADLFRIRQIRYVYQGNEEWIQSRKNELKAALAALNEDQEDCDGAKDLLSGLRKIRTGIDTLEEKIEKLKEGLVETDGALTKLTDNQVELMKNRVALEVLAGMRKWSVEKIEEIDERLKDRGASLTAFDVDTEPKEADGDDSDDNDDKFEDTLEVAGEAEDDVTEEEEDLSDSEAEVEVEGPSMAIYESNRK